MKCKVEMFIELDDTGLLTIASKNESGEQHIHVFENGSIEQVLELVKLANIGMSKALDCRNLKYASKG